MYDVVIARVAQPCTTISVFIAYIWTDKQEGESEHLLVEKPMDKMLGNTFM